MRLNAQLRGERLVIVKITNAPDWKTKVEATHHSEVLEYPIGPGKGKIESSNLYVAANQRTAFALLRPRDSSPKPNPRVIGDGDQVANPWGKGLPTNSLLLRLMQTVRHSVRPSRRCVCKAMHPIRG